MKEKTYTGHAWVHPFKDNHFWAQICTCAATFASTSDKFRSNCRSGPNYSPRMRTGPSHQQKGSERGVPLYQGPSCNPLLFFRFILASEINSYLTRASFTATMTSQLDTNTVTSSEKADTLAVEPLWRIILRRVGLVPASLSLLSCRSNERI